MFLLIDLVTHNLYMYVTTNVVLAIPSINEYCMHVNVDARSDELDEMWQNWCRNYKCMYKSNWYLK